MINLNVIYDLQIVKKSVPEDLVMAKSYNVNYAHLNLQRMQAARRGEGALPEKPVSSFSCLRICTC
jgi:hypothetical protein